LKRFAFAIVFLATPFLARAADDEKGERDYVHADLWELNLSVTGSWMSVEGSDVDTIRVGGDGSIGYFLTDWLEIGLKGEGLYTESETEDGALEFKTTNILGGPQILFNLPTGTPIVPFAVGAGGVAYTKAESDFEIGGDTFRSRDDEVGAFWEAGGGLRFFPSHWAAITLRVTFQQLLFEDIADQDMVVGSAGISLFF
jgi:hypothetical protein